MDTNYYKTFQVYLEAGDALSDPTPAQGQTYGEQTPTLPFTPTHLITLRSASEGDASFGPWNGAWRRDQDQWSQLVRFTPGSEWWSSPSGFTLSARIDRAWLGSPSRVRLAAHLVNLSPGEDWKDTLPPTHAPWTQDGGDFYELDLSGPALPAAQWPTR
jgi:hypothetical protein